MENVEKKCLKCKRFKSIRKFQKNKREPDGHCSYCGECNQFYVSNRNKMAKKTCFRCGESKFIHNGFYRNKARKDGTDTFCKECRKIYSSLDKEKKARHRREKYHTNAQYRELHLAKQREKRRWRREHGTDSKHRKPLSQIAQTCPSCRVGGDVTPDNQKNETVQVLAKILHVAPKDKRKTGMSFKTWAQKEVLKQHLREANRLYHYNDYRHVDIARYLRIKESSVPYLIYETAEQYEEQLELGFRELPARYQKYLENRGKRKNPQ